MNKQIKIACHPKFNKTEVEAVKPVKVRKILIVEDNFIARCGLQEMLAALGYSADFAEDGRTALALYTSNYALILMDIDLPDISGIEVTETIRKIEKGSHSSEVPIIAITSHYDEFKFLSKCKKAGMNDISNKPNLAQLKEWISEYVEAN